MNRAALKTGLASMALSVVLATPSFGHHSFAMFDMQKRIEVQGTVKEFRWTNPHSWLILTSKDSSGKSIETNIEMNGPGYLVRNGWKRESLKAGDAVKATINPLRDGSSGGNLIKLVFPDGRELSAEVRISLPPGTALPPNIPATGEKP